MGFPNIPGVTYNGIHHTGDLWDFGPKFDDGILSVLPPRLLGTPYEIFVPRTDADGNDIAGIRLPDVAVPVATYTGWGLRAAAAGDPVPIVDGCDASGQRLPFAETKAERVAAGDPRRSLQERYKDHASYVGLVTAAATSSKATDCCSTRTCKITSPRPKRRPSPDDLRARRRGLRSAARLQVPSHRAMHWARAWLAR